MNTAEHRLERIEVKGIVQGVGFRPFVYNLANKHHLYGYVQNNPDGVVIEVEGEPKKIKAFVSDLQHGAPVLSRILEIQRKGLDTSQRLKKYCRFEIRTSDQKGKPITLISPDVCVCDDCLSELFDLENRRYLYPFINCPSCVPRFTIIRQLPYDRPFTTMARFSLCPECKREYNDPYDRRFHAQPNACPVCGPELQLVNSEGENIQGNPVLGAIELLQNGQIVAVKGLGGFHLAVDGTNEAAVKRLRLRKHREEKPLALMVDSIETARSLVILGETEEQVLTSRERPIVLAYRHDNGPETSGIADSVAPYNVYLGIMLPYTPLHFLLFFHPQAGGDYSLNKPVFTSLVMTSGNITEEPICKDNNEVLHRLSGVADAFLIHNRDVYVRCDDSVINVIGKKISLIRRSRGFAPAPVFLPHPVPQVLAFGGELKNTLCITEGRRAFVSQYIGDLENVPTLGFFKEAVSHFTKILDINPRIFAYDLHPEYLSTKHCKEVVRELEEDDYAAVGVQHHHAHIASVLAEHGYTGPVIGFSMDGTGYGLDGAIWGGEVLLCTPAYCERFAHLDYMPLPGGTAAIKEPWRMAFSYLRAAFGEDLFSLRLPCLQKVSDDELELLDQACKSGLNCPSTSALGRLFDAAASILDIRHFVAFEAQAAMMLETFANNGNATATMPYTIQKSPEETVEDYPVLWGNISQAVHAEKLNTEYGYILDYIPLVRNLVEGIRRGRSKSELATAFHHTLVQSFLEIAERAREITGITTVALSGGCWQNRILSERFQTLLSERGFTVLINLQVPVNDGGISLGQAFVAAALSKEKLTTG